MPWDRPRLSRPHYHHSQQGRPEEVKVERIKDEAKKYSAGQYYHLQAGFWHFLWFVFDDSSIFQYLLSLSH